MRTRKRISIVLVQLLTLLWMSNLVAYSAENTHHTKSTSSPTIVDVTDYGAVANSGNDASHALRQAISAAKNAEGPVILNFPKGVYDFQSSSAERLPYYISNTTSQADTPQSLRSVGLLFKDMENLTIQGNGSTLMFHGLMTPIVLDHVTNVEVNNIKFDFKRPVMSEITISAVGSNYLEATVHADSWYSISEGRLTWIGENGWSQSQTSAGMAQQYDPSSKKTWRSWNPVSSASTVQDLGNRKIRLNYSGTPDRGATVGQIYQIRNTVRYEQGAFIYRSKDITWTDVDFYAAPGLGIVSQYSENLDFLRLNFRPREGSGRTNASMADFMQFSGIKGEIRVVDSNFFGAHDDPINIHGTHLRIVEKPASNQIKVRFMHHESWGFDAFTVNDKIDFINGSTLTPYESATITAVSRINNTDILLTLDKKAPDSIKLNNDVVENVTWTPNVTITGSTFESAPTRGLLVTTRGTVRIENNTFHKMPMSAILIADDAQSWYESGMVRDVTIKNNVFNENGGPVIYVAPENNQFAGPVHSNITVDGNTFRMLDNTLLQVKATEALQLINNKIIRANPLPNPNQQNVINLTQSQDVVITGNTFEGQGVNKTIQLDRTPIDTVTIAPEQQLNVVNKDELKSISFFVQKDQALMKATGTTEATANGSALNAIDGNSSTIWHSEWTPMAPLPQSISIHLGSNQLVKGLSYLPRQDGSKNGMITKYNIYVSSDGTQYTKIASGDWTADATEKQANFTPITAAHIKLEAIEGFGGFASAAEIQILKDYPVGKSMKLEVKGITLGGYAADLSKATLSFSSDNKSVAQIDNNGIITGLRPGIANITATVTSNEKTIQQTTTFHFYTQDNVPVQRIEIDGEHGAKAINLPGGTLQMKATIHPSNADISTVQWKSYLPGTTTSSDVAIIDNTGLLTAKRNGIVEVKALSTDGSGVTGSMMISVSNQGGLSPKWSWIRENNKAWSLVPELGGIRITTEPGNLWATANNNKNILLYQPSSPDYTLVTKAIMKPTRSYEEGGLIVYKDDDNYFYVARKNHPGYGGAIFTIVSETNGSPREEYIKDQVQGNLIYLKVVKEGDYYSGYYSTDQSTWIQIGNKTQNKTITAGKVGLFANNAGGAQGSFGETFEFSDLQINDLTLSFFENVVDKTSLQDAIAMAQNVYNNAMVGMNPGEYPQMSKEVLLAAIEFSINIADKQDTTQDEINTSTTQLIQAVNRFKDTVIKGGLIDIKINGKSIFDFSPDQTVYFAVMNPEYIPIVSAQTNDNDTRVSIIQATSNPGVATVRVMNQNYELIEIYTIHFLVEVKNPVEIKLTGPSSVISGEEFNVQVGLDNELINTNAQDITVTYNPDELELISSDTMKESLLIVTEKESPGQIRFITAVIGPGTVLSGDLLQFKFKAKPVSMHSVAGIFVYAIMADADGTESTLDPVAHSIAIKFVDKEILRAAIASAQSKHDAAVEGTIPGQYKQGSKAALQAAIDKATAVMNGLSTPEQVSQALIDLEAAMNIFDQSMIVHVPGDLNWDGKITIGDLAIVAKAYGKTAADSDWELYKLADINEDDRVDIEDLAAVAKQILLQST